jgi:hypothetical protein
MGTRGSFPEAKAAGAWSSPPSSAEAKECVGLNLHPQYDFMAWCSVKKHGENFTFTVICETPTVGTRSFSQATKRPQHEADRSPNLVPKLRKRGALPPIFIPWCLSIGRLLFFGGRDKSSGCLKQENGAR